MNSMDRKQAALQRPNRSQNTHSLRALERRQEYGSACGKIVRRVAWYKSADPAERDPGPHRAGPMG